MIVSFTVANFRSFAEEQTFSLVASKRLGTEHNDHTFPIPDSDERVLRAGVLYGANGAGKSNLLKALAFLKDFTLRARGQSQGTGRQAFRLSNLEAEPTSFDLQFIVGNKLYRYGISLNDDRIVAEWLLRVIGNKEKSIYERSADSSGKLAIVAPDLKKVGAKLDALMTVGGPSNQSFLATVFANLEATEVGEDLLAVIAWMSGRLVLIGPDERYASVGEALSRDTAFLAFAGEFLRSASTGVENLQVDRKELSEEELGAMIHRQLLSTLIESVPSGRTSAFRIGPAEILIDKTKDTRIYQLTTQAAHQGENRNTVFFDLPDESDGTQRLLELLPALYRLQTEGAVYFVDEIDRSMHPALVYKFLEYFLRRKNAANCQLIVTTHETNLLNLDLVRRDEIWFAEKDSDGATHLYSLTDFAVRKDLQISKGYMQGRFGAVPFLGDLDRLAERQAGGDPQWH